MFDVGFSELLLCFVVALIVLGPEKLPQVARALGRWTGRARAYVRNLTAELDREADGFNLKRDLDAATRELREGVGAVREDLRKLTDTSAATPPRPEPGPGPGEPKP